jgi:hypothetical protein
LAASALEERCQPRERLIEGAEVYSETAELFLVVAIGRGVSGGCELLTGPLEVGDCARKAHACPAVGGVRNLRHKKLQAALDFLERGVERRSILRVELLLSESR